MSCYTSCKGSCSYDFYKIANNMILYLWCEFYTLFLHLVITCDNINVPSNASIISWQPVNGSRNYNANITFQCNTGLWFSRGVYVQSVVCDNTGNWTSIGLCAGEPSAFSFQLIEIKWKSEVNQLLFKKSLLFGLSFVFFINGYTVFFNFAEFKFCVSWLRKILGENKFIHIVTHTRVFHKFTLQRPNSRKLNFAY